MSLFNFFEPGRFPGYIRSENGSLRLLTKPHFRYRYGVWQMIFRHGDRFKSIEGYTVADICADYLYGTYDGAAGKGSIAST